MERVDRYLYFPYIDCKSPTKNRESSTSKIFTIHEFSTTTISSTYILGLEREALKPISNKTHAHQ